MIGSFKEGTFVLPFLCPKEAISSNVSGLEDHMSLNPLFVNQEEFLQIAGGAEHLSLGSTANTTRIYLNGLYLEHTKVYKEDKCTPNPQQSIISNHALH